MDVLSQNKGLTVGLNKINSHRSNHLIDGFCENLNKFGPLVYVLYTI